MKDSKQIGGLVGPVAVVMILSPISEATHGTFLEMPHQRGYGVVNK